MGRASVKVLFVKGFTNEIFKQWYYMYQYLSFLLGQCHTAISNLAITSNTHNFVPWISSAWPCGDEYHFKTTSTGLLSALIHKSSADRE